MTEIKVYKKKTVIKKRDKEKVVVDIPFEEIDRAILS